MITVKIDPRTDGRYDMHVGDEGDQFVNSDQGYENPAECIAIARRLWPPVILPDAGWFDAADVSPAFLAKVVASVREKTEPVVMRVTYRNGKSHTEQLR